MWKLMFLAGVGGFFGTCCRFLVNRLFLVIWKAPFPLATFTVNIVGCLIFGIIFGILSKNDLIPQRLNALLIVGFCGGFTTFSTFSFETFNLGNNGQILLSFLYIGASVLVGLIAVWLGMLFTRWNYSYHLSTAIMANFVNTAGLTLYILRNNVIFVRYIQCYLLRWEISWLQMRGLQKLHGLISPISPKISLELNLRGLTLRMTIRKSYR